ncbi:response regulator transcription factor [Microbaculum sp. FT89]|uniref:response regulator transcription factor n=1 Tax=Microbaculum sp. FT89 TaxID=3447298 RepID=UPI003F52D32A
MHRILVVDDDTHIRDVICFALDKAGYATSVARDGVEALSRFSADRPSLIVLDVGMPEIDGLEVCRRIRKSSEVPILFLSARDDEVDRVIGLEIGGDDYVTKPFSPRELVARVGVILKRTGKPEAAPHNDRPLKHGDIVLDPARHEARLDGIAIHLTGLEFAILRAFFSRPGMIFTRDQIVGSAYGDNFHISSRTVDSHVRNIRAKFADAGCRAVIETVHGVGFRLASCTVDA